MILEGGIRYFQNLLFPFAGPLSGTSDGHSKKLNKESRAFGSHDIHSMNVISNLKKVTIALEGGADSMGVGSEIGGADQVGMANGNGPVEDDDEEDDDEGTSLDFTSLDIGPSSARQYRWVWFRRLETCTLTW